MLWLGRPKISKWASSERVSIWGSVEVPTAHLQSTTVGRDKYLDGLHRANKPCGPLPTKVSGLLLA